MNNFYDLLIEMLEARARSVNLKMLVDGQALKMVRDGCVVCMDGPGGELYIWSGNEGFNVLDTANGDPCLYSDWSLFLDELANDEDEQV